MPFHFLDRWLTNPGVAPAGSTIIPSPGICTWHCATFQSIASQLQIEPSLSAPQKCKGLAKNFSFASWQMLNFVSRGHWRDNVGRLFLPNSAVLYSVVACGTQLGYFQYPAPAMQAASFASGSCRAMTSLASSSYNVWWPASPKGQQLPGILPTGGFVEEWLQWTHPKHPRGWISSKFCQCSPIRTSLPSSEPQPCPPQHGLDLSHGVGDGSSILNVLSHTSRSSCSLQLRFLYSLEFFLLLIGWPSTSVEQTQKECGGFG